MTITYADSGEKVSKELKLDMKTEKMLDNISKKHNGVKFVPINQLKELKNVDKKDFININSEEELDTLIKNLRTTEQVDIDSEIVNSSIATYYEHIRWWSPASSIATGIFCWKNIIFNYTLNGASLIQLSNGKSYIEGLNLSVWHQNYFTYSLIGDYGANIVVDGYYVLGITIGGQPIGAVINDTWYRTWYWD